MTEYTLEELAEEYANTLAQPPNVWGQHISPRFGCQSHDVMRKAQRHYPIEEVNKAFTEAIQARGL